LKNSSKNRESQSFEEAFDRLKEIVSLIENPDNNLESMIELVEEGVALSRICEEKLKNVQDRINIISKNSSDCD
tara:strand:+ start:658 stop:879 length:222 start_codon:yes stop_codon:yes gene_type:complete